MVTVESFPDPRMVREAANLAFGRLAAAHFNSVFQANDIKLKMLLLEALASMTKLQLTRILDNGQAPVTPFPLTRTKIGNIMVIVMLVGNTLTLYYYQD
jgi:hypothetical protein